VISLKTGELKGLIDLGKGKHVAFVIEDQDGLLNFLELKDVKKEKPKQTPRSEIN
jgi:hypothetical protein